MGKDVFRIKVYRCDNKAFDTGLADLDGAIEKTMGYLEKMQPNLAIHVSRGQRR